MSPLAKTILCAATSALLTLPALGPASAQKQAPNQPQTPAPSGEFRDCLQNIRTDAIRQGVPAAVVDKAFQGLTPNQQVLDLDSRQPEFSLTYSKYIGNSVTPDRITKGQQKLAQYKALLDQLEREYGVPGQYIVSFWGMETNYGKIGRAHV